MSPRPTKSPLADQELKQIDAYWRAANYLSVGQIYLLDNPLLEKALRPDHIKPRLLGHWGTTPGLILIYVHLNRVIRKHDLDMIYVCGPGHGRTVTSADGSLTAHFEHTVAVMSGEPQVLTLL